MLEGETLLVILAALQASSAPALEVYQTPGVSAGARGSVTLFCNFTFRETSLGFYKWRRHHAAGDEVTNSSAGYRGRVSLVSPEDFMYHKSANIHLQHLDESDSGLYICAVTLITDPAQTAHGNGTFLVVTRDRRSQVAVTLSCSIIGVIVVLIFLSVTLVRGYHRKLPGCLLLRMTGEEEEEDLTYCTVEDVRSHVDEQTIPQQRNSSENRIYMMENWQYGPPDPGNANQILRMTGPLHIMAIRQH